MVTCLVEISNETQATTQNMSLLGLLRHCACLAAQEDIPIYQILALHRERYLADTLRRLHDSEKRRQK